MAGAGVNIRTMPGAQTSNTEGAPLAEVIRLRDSTEDVFLSTGAQLIQIAGLLSTVKGSVFELDRLGRGDIMDHLQRQALIQKEGFSSLAAEIGDVEARLKALSKLARGLESEIEGGRRSAMLMNMVLVNARIAISSIPSQQVQFVDFTAVAQVIVTETTDLLTKLHREMGKIHTRIQQAINLVEDLGARVKLEIRGAFDPLMEDVGNFEVAVRKIANSSGRIAEKTQAMLDATTVAVAGLQIGDSTRQRLDHICTILQQPPVGSMLLRKLAAEQMHDTAHVHHETLDQLSGSVSTLTSGLRDLVDTHLAAFAGAAGRALGAASLLEGADRIASALDETRILQGNMRKFGDTLDADFAILRDLVKQGEGFEHRTKLIGINAVLSCTKSGQDGLVLKEVADQLQMMASGVGDKFRCIRTKLNKIGEIGSAVTTGLEVLSRHFVEVPERLSQNIVPLILNVANDLAPVQENISNLQDSLGGMIFDLGPSINHCSDLNKLASEMSNLEIAKNEYCDELVGEDVLSEIYRSFSIEREREIFRTNFPESISSMEINSRPNLKYIEDDFFCT